jgi:hypothetical protein
MSSIDKKINNASHLRLLFLLLVIKWTLFTAIIFTSKHFKPSHVVFNFNAYLNYMDKLEDSSIESRKRYIDWWKLFTRNLNSSHPHFVFDSRDTKSQKRVCLGIITQDRLYSPGKTINHLNKVAMSILTRTKLKHRDKLTIVFFNTQPTTRVQNSSNIAQLSDLFHIRDVAPSSSVTSYTNSRDKESMDYAYILREMKKWSCEYIMVSEDDAIFKRDWFDVLESALDIAKRNQVDFFLAKFFTGYKLIDLDWLLHPVCIVEVLGYSATISFVLTRYLLRKRLNKIHVAVVFVNSLAIIFLLKSFSINPIKKNELFEYVSGFGTVSILYSNDDKLSKWINYLENAIGSYLNNTSTFRMPKDLLLGIFREANNYKELKLEPSIVQHIGMQSSLDYRDLGEVRYRQMFKSYSFLDNFKLIEFDENYLLK